YAPPAMSSRLWLLDYHHHRLSPCILVDIASLLDPKQHLYMNSRRKHIQSKPLCGRLAPGIVLALLVAGIGALGLARAQSADTVTPPACRDGRQLQIDRGSSGLWQMLLKLRTRASLLMIV